MTERGWIFLLVFSTYMSILTWNAAAVAAFFLCCAVLLVGQW